MNKNTEKQKKHSSFFNYLLSLGGELVPEEESRRDFKRHMDNVGPIAELHRQKGIFCGSRRLV